LVCFSLALISSFNVAGFCLFENFENFAMQYFTWLTKSIPRRGITHLLAAELIKIVQQEPSVGLCMLLFDVKIWYKLSVITLNQSLSINIILSVCMTGRFLNTLTTTKL